MGSTSSSAGSYYGAEKPPYLAAPFPKRQFGKDVAREFLIDPTYRNLNHGSFGSIPRAIQTLQRHYQDQSEARPDAFIRLDGPAVLERAREAVAPLLGADKETVVFVSNATTGVNTVLRNLVWADDGADEILFFNTTYGACAKTVQYVVELSKGLASYRPVQLHYPLTDAEVVARFAAAVKQSRVEGRRPRVALIDVVSSIPAVRLPFERLVETCRTEGILSLVDGAQGIGMVDLAHVGGEVKPDFFVSNCHKWLFAPRGCAVLHVPAQNHRLMRSTLPTSWSFDADGHAEFAPSFASVGTQDHSNYMCVEDAIRWRQEVLGGEERIREYVTGLAREGGKKVAEMLGTEVLENSEGTLGNCGMVNVGLPVGVAGGAASPPASILVPAAEAAALPEWLQRTLLSEYHTFLPIAQYNGRLWARFSAQVYLELDDFEWAAKALLEISEKIRRGDHKKADAAGL